MAKVDGHPRLDRQGFETVGQSVAFALEARFRASDPGLEFFLAQALRFYWAACVAKRPAVAGIMLPRLRGGYLRRRYF